MSAHADDLRYFYAAKLGNATEFAVTDAGSTKVPEALTPGRYLVYPIDLSGRVWVRQGAFDSVTAAAAIPSTPMDADSIKAFEVVVRGGESDDDGIAAIGATGASCTMMVVKISRGRS